MDSSEPHAPLSPFGPAPHMDLSGWRFGVLLRSPTKQKIGFFIDPIYMRSRCEAYARLVPGSPLSDAMLGVAFPTPIHSLLKRWTPDWRTMRHTPWLGADDKNLASVYPKYCPALNTGHLDDNPRFAFITANCTYLGMDDEERFVTLSQVCALWREELESRGGRCIDWEGAALVRLSNGFILDDILLEAGSASDSAFARADMQRELELIPVAKSGLRPRI